MSEKSSDDMKTPQAATLQERPAFLPPLERMRRERRLTLLFFTGFMLLAALFHLLAGAGFRRNQIHAQRSAKAA